MATRRRASEGADADPYAVCFVLGKDGQEQADARLIAAAPDMLAALKLFVHDYGMWGQELQLTGNALRAARAAIAKAEPNGKQMAELMRPVLGPVPNEIERDDFQSLGPMFERLREDQDARVQQIMDSWGFRKHGLPVSMVRRAIRKVLNNWT